MGCLGKYSVKNSEAKHSCKMSVRLVFTSKSKTVRETYKCIVWKRGREWGCSVKKGPLCNTAS